ncbi:hypothetical protein [Tunturiibacter gelidiferens]|uniref:hypothetical protein n=1 Tax=Tunturiibacter gelidiferens TaxID=3069689 RepID=UPI003D9AD7E4
MERGYLLYLLPNRVWTHLFMIPNDDYFLCHPESYQTTQVALTRFVDDNDIE